MQASDSTDIAGIYRLPAGIRRDPQGWLRLSIPFHQRRCRPSCSLARKLQSKSMQATCTELNPPGIA